jgi:RNA polymerase Rpb1, domain 3/RNA polymerase Rpb1, domain 6
VSNLCPFCFTAHPISIPQREETRAELSQIAWVPRQVSSNYFISSWYRDNIYCYRRSSFHKPTSLSWVPSRTLCGIRKFTLRDTFLDWSQVQNILLWVPEWDGAVPIPAIVKPKPLWSGKQILSMVIPRGINIHRSPDPKSSNPVFERWLQVGLDDSSLELQVKLDEEFGQLVDDRRLLREFVFPRTDPSKFHYLPVNELYKTPSRSPT